MRKDTAVRRTAATLTAVTVLAVLTSCGLPGLDQADDGKPSATPSDDFTPKAPLPSGKPLDPDARVPDPPKVDDGDPTSVAKAWAKVAHSHDTAYDTSPQDAVLRATGYFTKKKAKAEREHRPQAGAGAQWNEWAEHKAWTTVKVKLEEDGDTPVDTVTTAWRQLAIDGKARGRDDWKGVGPRLHAYVKLVRQDDKQPWRIDTVNVIEAATLPSDRPSDDSSADSTAQPE